MADQALSVVPASSGTTLPIDKDETAASFAAVPAYFLGISGGQARTDPASPPPLRADQGISEFVGIATAPMTALALTPDYAASWVTRRERLVGERPRTFRSRLDIAVPSCWTAA